MRQSLQTAYPRTFATPDEVAYNLAMNDTHESVEWLYKDTNQLFTVVGFSRLLHARQGPFMLLTVVCTLLRNIKTCTGHSTQLETAFQFSFRSLESYTTILDQNLSS